jgi:hypothetical protein
MNQMNVFAEIDWMRKTVGELKFLLSGDEQSTRRLHYPSEFSHIILYHFIS